MTTKIRVIVAIVLASLLLAAGGGAGWKLKRCPVVISPDAGRDDAAIATLLFTPVVKKEVETKWRIKTKTETKTLTVTEVKQASEDCRRCFETYEPIVAIAPAPRWSYNAVSGYAGFGVANLGQQNNIGGQFSIDYKPITLHGKNIHAALTVRAETFVSDSRIINPSVSGGLELKFGR